VTIVKSNVGGNQTFQKTDIPENVAPETHLLAHRVKDGPGGLFACELLEKFMIAQSQQLAKVQNFASRRTSARSKMRLSEAHARLRPPNLNCKWN
jgi:hypothetical protein